MNVLIFTRSPEHGSSITAKHWNDALGRNGLKELKHRLTICHSEADLAGHLAEADIIVSSRADLRHIVVPDNTAARYIFFAFAGVDHLAPFDWVPAGAHVVNNSGATGRAIGEYAITALLLLSNGIAYGRERDFASSAARKGFASLAGRTVTIVGAGGVGGAVAAMCGAFRMEVSGVRRSGREHPDFKAMYSPSDLANAIGESEFVVIACPVTAETRGLFDAAVIARMKPGAFLINIARGSIVDEDAVCDAVERGALGGAVLDVVSTSASVPGARVHNTPGILVTPHVSGDDKHHFIANSLDVCLINLKQFIEGREPGNAIDFDIGY